MKKENISLFFPSAKLKITKADRTEVREGTLFFNNKELKIKDGILYAPIKSKSAQVEQKAVKKIDQNPEMGGGGKNICQKDFFHALESLPNANNNPLFFRPGSFQNISFAADDFGYFLKFLKKSKQKLTILEIGADSGWATWQVAKLGHKVVGIDINHHLELRSFWLKKGVYFDFLQADMHFMPFRNEVFDLVFCFEAAHHSPDLKKLAQEIFRVLKPQGQIMFFREPMKGNLAKNGFGIRQKELGISENLYTFNDWYQAFKLAGFENLKIEPSNFTFKKIWLKVNFKTKIKILLQALKKILIIRVPYFRELTTSNYNFSGTKKSI